MLIAAKYEEIYPPLVSDFVYITDNTYTKQEILNTERDILSTLNFEISYHS
jgi:cyclin A